VHSMLDIPVERKKCYEVSVPYIGLDRLTRLLKAHVLVAQDVDTSGVGLEVVTGAEREAAPTSNEDAREVTVREDDHVRVLHIFAVRARLFCLGRQL
jgi:hypothetical protein